MTSSVHFSSHPAGRKPPERGLRRLDRALERLIADREAALRNERFISYVDFSELYAFAFRLEHEKPTEDFAGGRDVDEATATWMLALATDHLFKDWDSQALRMLPPHRAEMAGEFRRFQERIRTFQLTRQRLIEALPPEFRATLAAAPADNHHPLLIKFIMQGRLSTLCMELLERERDASKANRAFIAVRKLLDSKKLDLTDGDDITGYQPTYDELVPVEDALSRARRAERGINTADARALLYLRRSALALDRRVRFTTRSVAIRRALNDLVARDDEDATWARVKASLRVPEAVLLDFLAGPDAEGTEWLLRLRILLDQFLAQVDRARARSSDPDRELAETSRRAWDGLVAALNLRRSTREDAPQLLERCAPDESGAEKNGFARLAHILTSAEFQAQTDTQINALLDSIEREEWKIALTVSPEAGEDTGVPVRIARVRGNASVSFTSGAFQVSLYFAGEIGETLRKMPANGATPQKLIAALLASESAHGAEAYLLIAAILGALRRWEDAALYCTRAVEASAKNSVTVREARFFRGLCLRQTAQARSSDTEAYSRLSAAREDVEAAIASPTRSREGNRDPRYLKELGTIILVWVDQQLPETPGWTLNHALSVLDSARQLVSAEKNEALLIDILNNLCYGFALAGEATLERGLVHLAELESLASAQECSSLAVRDTILLLRAHDARIKRDTAALARLRDAFEDLVSVAEPREGTMEARRRHLQEVSSWHAELSAPSDDKASPLRTST